MPTVQCKQCGVSVHRNPCKIHPKGLNFCSYACHAVFLKASKKNLSDRDRDIANLVLRDGEKIKTAAIKHGISMVRARQILHRVCRAVDPVKYESGFHSERYGDGRTNDQCLPYLSFLRENADAFLPEALKR